MATEIEFWEDMRNVSPDICWAYTADDHSRVCILPLGHDDGIHNVVERKEFPSMDKFQLAAVLAVREELLRSHRHVKMSGSPTRISMAANAVDSFEMVLRHVLTLEARISLLEARAEQ